ncbi:protein lifeguard 1 [Betta splendens]|uniref:Protein lifeguard 1 n=1 Tax=Betta splendens TaxID=158456 RepID=A0A6P7KZH8_BETSP|nr:protein lifeguard 1 [Betta splendens]
MSDTALDVATHEATPDPGCDSFSPPTTPPPPSYDEQQLPPHFEAPPMYPEPQTEEKCHPDTADESFANIDTEAPTDMTETAPSPFEDKTVRRAFVRKVFSILTLQLLFTFSVVCVFTFSSVVKEAVQDDIWVYVSSFIIFLVVATSLSFCTSFSRRHPWNLVALALVTISLSYMVGTVASFHDTASVIIAMGATVAISMAIIAFSAQTRYDFTICYGIALVLAVDMIMFGFFSIFYYSVVTEIVYGCLGALLYSLFLMIDCQMIMGRKSLSLNPEDYVTAALKIYLDIILIFLYLMGRR